MEDNNLRMQQKKEHSKRIKRLGLLTTATAFIFIASTYAWFIGTQEVKINDFEVKIAATESLKLSLTGGDWADELTFGSRESLLSQVYATTTANEGEKDLSDTESPRNTNVVWPKYDGDLVGENASARKGLVPISTIGEMDKDTGKMKIFEKASFTPTPGGYRLIASQINNYTLVEGGPNTLTDYANQTQKGYVAFDLFVKNISGSYYNTELNGKDEEAIYLTTDSAVFGQDQAGNVYTTENDATKGIENSVRVAFAQIGRVHGDLGSDASTKDADLAVIQSITCINSTGNPTKNFVTGICGQKDTNVGAGVIRNAIIWEPNDKVHNTIALDYFKESCKQRVKFDSITNPGSQNA